MWSGSAGCPDGRVRTSGEGEGELIALSDAPRVDHSAFGLVVACGETSTGQLSMAHGPRQRFATPTLKVLCQWQSHVRNRSRLWLTRGAIADGRRFCRPSLFSPRKQAYSAHSLDEVDICRNDQDSPIPVYSRCKRRQSRCDRSFGTPHGAGRPAFATTN